MMVCLHSLDVVLTIKACHIGGWAQGSRKILSGIAKELDPSAPTGDKAPTTGHRGSEWMECSIIRTGRHPTNGPFRVCYTCQEDQR
jgi:hypothetical protein